MTMVVNDQEVPADALPKVSSFITRPDSQLLVFSHSESPEVVMQVPAGGIEPGEDPAVAALREAEEETGYAGFTIERFVDRQLISEVRHGRRELHDRWFFHLAPPAGLPDRWRHGEGSAVGADDWIPFEFCWINFRDEPLPLTPDHAAVFRQLRELRSRDDATCS